MMLITTQTISSPLMHRSIFSRLITLVARRIRAIGSNVSSKKNEFVSPRIPPSTSQEISLAPTIMRIDKDIRPAQLIRKLSIRDLLSDDESSKVINSQCELRSSPVPSV